MSEWTEQILAASAAALPPLEGEIALERLTASVEVVRDGWGVPDLYAASEDDLFLAQGFVSASERLFQIDLTLRAATGRLSELFGDLTLEADRFARVVGLSRIAAADVARYDETSRRMLERFVRGVHAWIGAMPAPPVEYAILGSPPDLPRDPETWAAPFALVAWGLSGNADVELVRARLADRLGVDAAAMLLPPAPASWPAVPAGGLDGRTPAIPPRPTGVGSNGWVVSGARTTSGKPILANDPHLLVQQPGAWLEIGLHAPGLDVKGVAFPFAPGVVIGATPHHAWGLTNVSGDVQDLYLERLSDDGTSALFDGAREPLSVRREEIAVRGGEPVTLDVRETRHGPLLEVVPIGLRDVVYEPTAETYALRWTATEGLVRPSTLRAMARASSFEAFREALRHLECPGQNVVYADTDGTIGYQCTGRYPIRAAGDGTVPVPGWTSEHEWEGWIPFEELPWARDPAAGRIVTANQRIHDDDYPHRIGEDAHAPFRAARIVRLLDDAGDDLDVATVASMQADVVSMPARRLLPTLLDRTHATSRAAGEALGLLREWDGAMAAGSGAAAVYQTWVGRIERAVLGEDPALAAYLTRREPFVCAALPSLLERDPPSWCATPGTWDDILSAALAETATELAEALGADPGAWRWGGLHEVRFAHPLARAPGLGEVFLAGAAGLGGDDQTVLQAAFDARRGFEAAVVPSWRVVFDLDDLDRSVAVLPTGNSGNPASDHWADQWPLWLEGRHRPFPFSRAAVEAAARSTLLLVPR